MSLVILKAVPVGEDKAELKLEAAKYGPVTIERLWVLCCIPKVYAPGLLTPRLVRPRACAWDSRTSDAWCVTFWFLKLENDIVALNYNGPLPM